MGWVKLQFGNDWGSKYLAVEPEDERGMCSLKRGIVAPDGERIMIRMLDGSILAATISNVHLVSQVRDMGHSYDVSSTYPSAIVDLCGTKVAVSLDSVEVTSEWADSHTPWKR